MPPTITRAKGRCVSLPIPVESAIGNRPKSARSAAISTARSFSTLPCTTASPSALPVFELAAPGEVIAVRELHPLGDHVDGVAYHRAHVSSFDVELERKIATVRFAVDVGGAGGDADLRELAQRHAAASRPRHGELADGLVVFAYRGRQHQPHR